MMSEKTKLQTSCLAGRQANFKQNGFTLIELLVVITIIVVISTIAMISYAGSGKKARDSRRISDLEKVRLALEMVRQVGSTYPATATVQTILVPIYLQLWPSDPKSNSYIYTRDTSYSYHIDAVMEDLGSTNGSYGSGYNYRVTNL